MKRTIKKASVFLLAALMLATMFVPAMAAYTAVSVTGTPANVKWAHSLEITDSPYNLDYDITYSFTAGAAAAMPGSPATGVSGVPTIADISYGPTAGDNFATAANHKISKEAAITWTNVSFTEPGTYYWPISSTVNKGSAPENASTNTQHYLYAFVADNNGALEVNAVGVTTQEKDTNGVPTLATKTPPVDQYPSTTNDLTVSKTVTGNMGSKEQYFKFEITVTLPAGIAARDYTISGNYDTNVPATAYNQAQSNPSGTINLAASATATYTIDVWLKHGQSFKIEQLPYNTTYSITESNNDGYTVTIDNAGTTVNGNTATGTITDAAKTVAYTNNKTNTPPTGILLQYGAPIAGVLLVAGLMAVLFATKRRKEQEAE
ncbi:MAG: hypothetical protein IKI49_02775 [Oscillospiraceae bacterium]|nr:hypothetical protein [Oscillospiraceae bacterium]